MIDIESKNIRLELVHEPSTEILKTLILHHIGYNSNIITDSLEAYNWLEQ